MRNRAKQRGQGITEYVIIVALVVIAIIGVAVTFGDDIRQMLDNSGASAASTTNAAAGVKTTQVGGTGTEGPKK